MSSTGPTGLQGQDGLQGQLGPTGIAGPVGLTGWGAGVTPGPAGPISFNLSNVASGTSITVTTASLGTKYYITTTEIAGITLPASMSGITEGAFWTFDNSTLSALIITLTNGTAVYVGNASAGSITAPAGTGFTLVYSGTAQGYIVF
jgi:collagen type VII alpha